MTGSISMPDWAEGAVRPARRISLGDEARAAALLRNLRASYQAAETGRENQRHWVRADSLDANSANSPEVRRILRNRSRFEIGNNCYAQGMVETLADYVVGDGPRLQVVSSSPDANRFVEREFSRWAAEVQLGQKLWTARVSQAENGEAFGQLANNAGLAHRVKLDLRLFEADQVATPVVAYRQISDPLFVDGIELDRDGRPVFYHFLRAHPGSANQIAAMALEFDRVPAKSVVHLFRRRRAGQARGIPELTAALPLFALLRRYTLAVLMAAENAAAIGGVIYSETLAETGDEPDPLDEIDVNRGTFMTLPAGWKMGQIKAEQPTSTYTEFKASVLQEAARCLRMPLSLALGSSAGLNYSSGRLDHQAFFRSIEIDRASIESDALDRIFAAWMAEASLIEGYLPQVVRRVPLVDHRWFWSGLEHVDPTKEATAASIRLEQGTSSLAIECSRSGYDWEEVMRQRAVEARLAEQLQIPVPSASPTAGAAAGAPVVDQAGGAQ